MTNPTLTADRQRLRRTAAECRALVAVLNELYPANRLPELNATDREIGEWIGQRKLVERLNALLSEAGQTADGSLPKAIGG